MPYLSEKKIIAGTKFDRRVKLTDEDKKLIIKLREEENISHSKLASRFNVNKRTIQFILNPASLEENKKRREERGGSKIYYDKDKQTEDTRNHRRYKQDLHIKNLI